MEEGGHGDRRGLCFGLRERERRTKGHTAVFVFFFFFSVEENFGFVFAVCCVLREDLWAHDEVRLQILQPLWERLQTRQRAVHSRRRFPPQSCGEQDLFVRSCQVRVPPFL